MKSALNTVTYETGWLDVSLLRLYTIGENCEQFYLVIIGRRKKKKIKKKKLPKWRAVK